MAAEEYKTIEENGKKKRGPTHARKTGEGKKGNCLSKGEGSSSPAQNN
jgi:hypothetical protein